MRTVTSGLVTLEIRHLKCHPFILILKYENNAANTLNSHTTQFVDKQCFD